MNFQGNFDYYYTNFYYHQLLIINKKKSGDYLLNGDRKNELITIKTINKI